MAVQKKVLIPSYLIQKEGYRNESKDTSKTLYHVHGAGGSLLKDSTREEGEEQIFKATNIGFSINEDMHKDFTMEVTFHKSSSLTLLKFNGDNKTTSNTTISVNANGIYFNRWGGTLRKYIRYPQAEPDNDGFITITMVRTGNQILFYMYGVYQAMWTINTAFDDLDFSILGGSYTIKRFALSMDVALPPSLHYDNVKNETHSPHMNINFTNILDNKYDTRSFSNRMLKNIASYGQWIIALYDDGFMEAINRPRGIDRGTSIEEVTYDQLTGKTRIVLEDEQVFEFDAIVSPADTTEIPDGEGILSVDGIHKPLVTGEGINIVTVPRGENKAIYPMNEDLPIQEVSYITDLKKPIGPLDFSKRASLKYINRVGAVNYPKLSPNPLGISTEWQEIQYDASTSNVNIFDIDENGEITLPKGEIFIRGFIIRRYMYQDTYSLRITDGVEDIVSKLWSTSQDSENLTGSSFKFEKRVFLFEEKKVRVEEIIYGNNRSDSITKDNGIVVSKIDFFKL